MPPFCNHYVCYLSKGMEVIHSISVPLFDYHYSTVFSTVKVRVLKVCEQSLHILLTRTLSLRLRLWKKVQALLQYSLYVPLGSLLSVTASSNCTSLQSSQSS